MTTETNIKYGILVSISAIFVVALIFIFCPHVYADQESTWDKMTEKCSIHQADEIANERFVIQVKKAELTYKADIESFDVSEKQIVIVFSDGTIGLFDKNMNMKKGYKINASDTPCGVIFHNDNVVIFKIKRDYATEITQDGKFVALYDTPDDNLLFDDFAYANIRSVGQELYYMSYNGKMKENVQGHDAPYLIRETKKGGKEILYDSYKYHRRKMIIFYLLVAMSFAVGITCIVVICRKGYRQKSIVDMFRQFKRDYGRYYDGDM